NIFFLSSRRRHTRSNRDWSSDVCSSDLVLLLTGLVVIAGFTPIVLHQGWWQAAFVVALVLGAGVLLLLPRLTKRLPSLARLWSQDRKSTRLNSSHDQISYAVFCLKKKKN